jgi:DNA-binding response OmpR family regulator
VANVLIAEDETNLADTLAEILRGAGHQVRVATTAARALELARESQPDVVISDWALGGPPDGVDLIQQLRVTRPRLAAILMTAHPSAPLRAWAGDDPSSGMLEKPFSLAEFRAAVARVLRAAERC